SQVHHGEILSENVGETALRQPPMQRRLPALEAVERDPAARGLPFAAAARGLAFARADTAPDPLRPVVRARIVSDLVELHRLITPARSAVPRYPNPPRFARHPLP